jgi:hypothetical protein
MSERRWRGPLIAAGGVVVFNVLFFISSSPDAHDVQPWLGLAVLASFVGGALSVYDSWSRWRGDSAETNDRDPRDY